MTDATQLLRDYADHGSEPAFRELVGRYIQRSSGSSDRRLRALYNSQRGLPFKKTTEL
jgi:hypothetical protein